MFQVDGGLVPRWFQTRCEPNEPPSPELTSYASSRRSAQESWCQYGKEKKRKIGIDWYSGREAGRFFFNALYFCRHQMTAIYIPIR
jgi:hypothetical protein